MDEDLEVLTKSGVPRDVLLAKLIHEIRILNEKLNDGVTVYTVKGREY